MNNALPQKAQKMLDQVIQMIQPAAIKAAGPVLVDLKRESGDATPDKQGIFTRQLNKSLTELFQQLLAKPDPKDANRPKRYGNTKEEMEARISKYSLMDTELLEAMLVEERLCASLEQEYQYEVDCFGMRLEKYCGMTFEREKNPLHAKHLTTVFRQSCDALSPNKLSSDTAIENWGKVLKQIYPKCLENLNQSLIKQHILPHLDLDDINQRYEKKGQEKAREMRKSLIADITGKPQSAIDNEVSDAELMQSIKALVASAAVQRPELGKHLVSGTAGGPVADREEVLNSLRQIIQTPIVNEATGYREQNIDEKTLAEKIKTLTNMPSRTLDDQTQNSISLLSMMFDKLQQEEQIADPIKPLINELQVPLLKLAVTNEDFFSNPDNPAQELINEIAKAGTHWTPKQNVSKDIFYKKISSIVEDINASSESDEGNEFIFEEKLLSLKDFLEKEEKRSTLLEERIIQAESVKARTDAARASAERIIARKIETHHAGQHTATLLQNYWQQVLFFYLNRDDGDDSAEQTQVIELINALLIADPENPATDIDLIFEQLITHLHHLGLEVIDRPLTFSLIRKEVEALQNQARAVLEAAEADRAAAAAQLAAEQAAEQEAARQLQIAAEQAAAEQAAAEQAAARLQAAAEQAAAEQAAAAQAAAQAQEAAEKAAAEQAAARLQAAAEKAAAEQAAAARAAAQAQEAAKKAAAEKAEAEKVAAEKAAARQREAAEKAAAAKAARETIQAEELAFIKGETEENQDTSAEDTFDHQASRLRAESWFRLSNENYDKAKIKLAAIIKHNGNYIFVNREGIKVITTQKAGVAAMLRSGQLTVIDDAVFFDRALESVIHSLRT